MNNFGPTKLQYIHIEPKLLFIEAGPFLLWSVGILFLSFLNYSDFLMGSLVPFVCAILALWGLHWSEGAVVQDYDKCTLWLRTDGSSCEPNPLLNIKRKLMQFVPSVNVLEKCCNDGTGCFSFQKDSPWECYNELPDCMDEMRPRFLFYTPERTQDVQMIDYFDLTNSVNNLQTSDEVRPFVVIVHGFGKDWPKPWMFNQKDSWIKLGYNALIVDWTGGSREPFYFKAASNTRTIGAAIAKVMQTMATAGKLDLSTSTVTGFSLGGQICGYVGAALPGLKRIIAMDPAGPFYQCMHPKARLDPTDAQFVQVIHTHGEYFLMGGCGSLQQFGHVDFFINGGTKQAGCDRGLIQPQVFTDMAHLNFTQMVEDVSCSHQRAPIYLNEMVQNAADPANSCNYTGFLCNNKEEWQSGSCFNCPAQGCPVAGPLLDLGAPFSGRYYVDTHSNNATTKQFCGRNYLVSLKSNAHVKGKITVKVKGAGQESKSYDFQGTDDVLNAGEFKNRVIVAPQALNVVEQVEVYYKRNKLLLTGGPTMWTLKSVTVKDASGSLYSSSEETTVTDGSTKIVSVAGGDA